MGYGRHYGNSRLDAGGGSVVVNSSGNVSVTGNLSTTGTIVADTTGANAIGGAAVGGVQLELTGTQARTQGFRVTSRLQPGVGLNAFLVEVAGTIDEGASDTHPNFASLHIQAPIITAGDAALTNASTLKIVSAPTGATNNYALWVDAGTIRSDGVFLNATVTTLANDATPNVNAGNLFKTGGTTTITDFDLGVVGQTIQIISAHAITITDGAPIILNGSVNFVMAAADTLTLTMFDDQVWQEVGRMVNL